jgi:predicted methyltransferase MtxX (methanogen marker protein 4)
VGYKRCRNPGLALPLIALQYHEVKFNITFASLASIIKGSGYGSPSLDASLYVDYIYLDTDERRQFAQVQHEKNVLKSEHQTCLLVIVY